MSTTSRFARILALGVCLFTLAGSGCEPEQPAPRPTPTKKVEEKPAEAKKTPLGKNVWLEVQGDRRRVLVSSSVCLRDGGYGLECLLCRAGTKEHESILVTSADARIIHLGLEAARAKPGGPVEFEPKFKSPHGSRIKVTLQYEDKGKVVTVPAQQWIKNGKTKKDLEHDWVFAGSRLYEDPDDKKPLYAANDDGAYICVSNVMSAMLDLPVNSPRAIEERVFEFNTERIPPLKTVVVVILEPLPEEKPAK